MTTKVEPNFEKSWDFLQRFHPGRSVVVTGIGFDRKMLPTETFTSDERKRFLEWVSAAAKTCNLYFHVGEPLAPMQKKMERTDIKAVHWLHVDVDPVKGKPIDEERNRILAALRGPAGIPPPTCITFSGGGYQAYWKLREPIEINGDLGRAEETKLYNVHIENMLGADNCHDISRIMRLPYSVNIPNEKKRKNGQTEMLAEVIEFDDSRVYDLSQFPKGTLAAQSRDAGTSGGDSNRIKAPANVRRLSHVDELGTGVGEKCKECIVNGYVPDDPKGVAGGSLDHFPSRSERLLWVCCELVRAGIDDEIIYSIITDDQFKISESVLEKGSGTERYALRQIERAKDEAISPELRELNEKHAVIGNFGGKCLVIEQLSDPILGRAALTTIGFDHFRNRYMNRKVIVGQDKNGNAQEMPMGEWWLRHPHRRQFERIVFAPERDVPQAYNLWQGWACSAKPGDWSLMRTHIFENVCAGSQEHFDYFMGWLANMVQRPYEPGFSAIVLRGKEGTGKSIIQRAIARWFGRHALAVTQPSHLVGNFNSHLRDCVFLAAEEAFFAGDKRHQSVLKMLITEPTIMVEKKGIDVEQSANCTHLMMLSNEKWVIPAGAEDRRYFVLDVSSAKRNDHAYFSAIQKQMDNGGVEAWLHDMRSYDLTNFNVRKVPTTEALQAQKMLSMDPETEWWYQVLKRGTLLPTDSDWHDDVAVEYLNEDFAVYTRRFGSNNRGSATKLGAMLQEVVPGGVKTLQRRSPLSIKRADGSIETVERPRFYRFPSLAACRKHFDENHGGPYKWDDNKLPDEDVPDYGSDKPQTEPF